jgi:hypothetical protein
MLIPGAHLAAGIAAISVLDPDFWREFRVLKFRTVIKIIDILLDKLAQYRDLDNLIHRP